MYLGSGTILSMSLQNGIRDLRWTNASKKYGPILIYGWRTGIEVYLPRPQPLEFRNGRMTRSSSPLLHLVLWRLVRFQN